MMMMMMKEGLPLMEVELEVVLKHGGNGGERKEREVVERE